MFYFKFNFNKIEIVLYLIKLSKSYIKVSDIVLIVFEDSFNKFPQNKMWKKFFQLALVAAIFAQTCRCQSSKFTFIFKFFFC